MSYMIAGRCQFCGEKAVREGHSKAQEMTDPRILLTPSGPGFNGGATCHICYDVINKKLTAMYEAWCKEELTKMAGRFINDPSVLPNTVEFRTDGKLVGKITNLKEE